MVNYRAGMTRDGRPHIPCSFPRIFKSCFKVFAEEIVSHHLNMYSLSWLNVLEYEIQHDILHYFQHLNYAYLLIVCYNIGNVFF